MTHSHTVYTMRTCFILFLLVLFCLGKLLVIWTSMWFNIPCLFTKKQAVVWYHQWHESKREWCGQIIHENNYNRNIVWKMCKVLCTNCSNFISIGQVKVIGFTNNCFARFEIHRLIIVKHCSSFQTGCGWWNWHSLVTSYQKPNSRQQTKRTRNHNYLFKTIFGRMLCLNTKFAIRFVLDMYSRIIIVYGAWNMQKSQTQSY